MLKIKSYVILCTCLLFAWMAVGCTDDIRVDEDSLTAQFSFEKSYYLTNEEVVIKNTTQGGSGNYHYEWDFGDGRTSTEAEPHVAFNEIGAYTVTLNVHDSKGRYAMAHKILSVEPEPLPEVGNMVLKWVADQPLGTIRSIAPAVSNDNFVFMTSEDHIARKFDGATGRQVWQFDLRNASDGPAPEGNTHVSPSIDSDGTSYFGTGNTSGKIARLYAINPDGTKKWVMSSDANTGFWNKGNPSTPRLHYIICPVGDNFIYVGNAGGAGSVLAVDKTTGFRSGYAASSVNDGGPNGGATGGLVLSGSTVAWYGAKNGVFGCSSTALDAGGNVAYWQVANGKTSDTGNGSLAVGADGTIYGCARLTQGEYAGTSCVFAISPSGSELWRCSIGITGNLDLGGAVVASDGSIIVTAKRTAGEFNGGVYCVSPTGQLMWKYGIAEDVSGCAAIDQAGNIHFGTESGNYYIIKPVPGDDQLVLKKDIAAMIAESDAPMASAWSAGGGKIWSSPTIGNDGTIYIGITNNVNSSSNALVALHDDGITGPAQSSWPMRGKDARHTSRVIGGGSVDPGNDPSASSQLPLTWKMKDDMKSLAANPRKVWMCAHRGITGAGIKAGVPENSIAAIDYAVKAGAEMLEIDVRPTKDGVLVLMHDESIDRTTTGSGKVADMTYAQLQQYFLKDYNTGKATSYKVPTLEEAFKHGRGKIYFNLDISDKLVPGDATGSLMTMAKLMQQLDMENQAVVYVGGKMSVVNALKDYPSLLIHPYVGAGTQLSSWSTLGSVFLMQMSTDDGMNNISLISNVRNIGCLPYVNSLNGPDNSMAAGNFDSVDKIIDNGVSIIQTNYADILGPHLKTKGLR